MPGEKKYRNVKPVLITLPPQLLEDVRKKLEKDGRYTSFSGLIRDLLRRYLRDEV